MKVNFKGVSMRVIYQKWNFQKGPNDTLKQNIHVEIKAVGHKLLSEARNI